MQPPGQEMEVDLARWDGGSDGGKKGGREDRRAGCGSGSGCGGVSKRGREDQLQTWLSLCSHVVVSCFFQMPPSV